MAKLVIGVSMFSMSQNIYRVDGDKVETLAATDLEQIPEAVNALMGKFEDIDEIELDGPNKYIEKYGYDILSELEKNYAERNVRVKLNGTLFNQ